MRSEPPTRPIESEDPRDDSEFQELLAKYVEEAQVTGFVDPEEVLRDHPDLGPAILEDLETYAQFRREDLVQMPMPLGTLGDYTLRRQIGRGGMGIVYEAWENSMDRRVALKVMPKAVAVDTKAVARFIQEAQLAGRLSHPNIVHIHGMGVKEQIPYYAMDFVEGETLAQIMVKLKEAEPETETVFGKKDRPGYFERTAEVFAATADGLQHAHSMKVIHRDIKPSNLILDGEGRLRILDFGLARLEGQESLTSSGDFLGTPLYMSPEQARRKKIEVDHRTDVYSLGATLYEMLVLQPPFRGKDHEDTLSQIIERDPAEPRKLNPRVPKDLETIVLKCLRKAPGDRYGTAEALAQDLRRFLRGDPIEARPRGQWERLARRLRLHRARLLGAAAALVALLVVGWFAWKREEAEREAVRLRHDSVVIEAARDILRGQISLWRKGLALDSLRAFSTGTLLGGAAWTEERLRALADVARVSPERPDAPYYLARVEWALGDIEAARREAERALERSPHFAPAEVLLGEMARGGPPLAEDEIEDLLRRYRGGGGWQEPWLLAYKARWEGNGLAAVEACGRLLGFRRPEGEPYVGFTVEALVGRGLARLEAGDPEGAVLDFAGAWRLWPWFPEAALLLALAFHKGEKVAQAEAVLDELYSSGAPETRDELAARIAMWWRSLGERERGREWTERIAGWQRHWVDAYVLFHEGRFEESVAKSEQALEAGREGRLSMLGLARYLILADRHGPSWDEERREVLALARRDFELRPNDLFAAGFLSFALEANGFHDEALAAARSVHALQLRLGEKHFLGPWCLAWVLGKQGKLAEAEATLRAALEELPNDHFRAQLARVLDASGRNDEALREYEAWIARGYHAAYPYAGAAGVLNRLGRYEEAAAKARLALERLPRNTPAYENLAFALWKLGRPEEALEACQAGLEALPGRVRLRVVRGWILEEEGELEEAVRSFCVALADHPEDAEAHEALRRTLRKLGKTPRFPELSRAVEVLEARAPWAREQELILGTLSLLRRAEGGEAGPQPGQHGRRRPQSTRSGGTR